MIIAIPTQNNNSAKAVIHGHFGSAPYYAIFNNKTNQLFFIANDEKSHTHGQCQPTAGLINNKVEAVICNALGARAIMNLNRLGIKIYYGEDLKTLANLIKRLQNDNLAEFDYEEACQQHECQ